MSRTHKNMVSLVLEALRVVAKKVLGEEIEHDDTLSHEITAGRPVGTNQTEFHVVLSGRSDLGAQITVHNNKDNKSLIEVLLLTYRRRN